MDVKRALNEIFYPSGIKCIVCDDDIPADSKYPVCRKCGLEINLNYCLRCGRHTSAANQYCDACKEKTWFFEKARAPFVYKGNVKQIIYRLKYGNGRYIAKEIAPYLADAYYEHSLMSDIITFVPMFFKKQRKRRYNQAEQLAMALAESVGKPVIPLLEKIAAGKSLARLNAKQRADAIRDTFVCSKDCGVEGKTILLVDDVFTTGATANECAKILKKKKAAEVAVLTFATSVQKLQLYA